MKTKIPTDAFVALTDDIADWLMLVSLGDKQYKSLVVYSNGGDSFNDEGLDMYIEWNNQVEEMLSTYFKMEDWLWI